MNLFIFLAAVSAMYGLINIAVQTKVASVHIVSSVISVYCFAFPDFEHANAIAFGAFGLAMAVQVFDIQKNTP